MLKNLNSPINEVDGKQATYKNIPATAKQFIIEALMSTPADDRSTGEQKFKRFQIGMKVTAEDLNTDLTPEEIVIIKECVGKVYGPLVVGQIYLLLN